MCNAVVPAYNYNLGQASYTIIHSYDSMIFLCFSGTCSNELSTVGQAIRNAG